MWQLYDPTRRKESRTVQWQEGANNSQTLHASQAVLWSSQTTVIHIR